MALSRPEHYADEILTITPTMMRIIAKDSRFDRAKMELTLGQFQLLSILAPETPSTMGRLSEAAGISLPAATEAVDRLVRAGMVKRRPDPADRRVVRVALTPRGRNALAHCHDTRRRRWVEILTWLTAAERKALVTHLKAFQGLLVRANDRSQRKTHAHSQGGRS